MFKSKEERETTAVERDADAESKRLRDEQPDQRWEYLARNLSKVGGPVLEDDFNKHGLKGWEFVAVAKDYAVFKRKRP